jgi:hypothetical protein
MSVKTQHPQYISMLPKWERCRDVADGQDAIYAGANRYLPALTGQGADEYHAYMTRTTFFNATWRTIVGLQGMLFRKPPTVEVPDAIKPMLEDVTLTGTPMHIFALETAEEALKIGRIGVFVDFPMVDTATTTIADAQNANLRPLLKMYSAFSIINWKSQNIDNETRLSMVVLTETRTNAVNEFEDAYETIYRVLDLMPEVQDDSTIKYVYRVRVFVIRKDDKGVESETVESVSFPMINNSKLDHIPFQFIGVDDVSPEVDEPPLIDLVDLNLAHYRVSADYEHGCHFTGLPTPVISGYTAETGQSFSIGSMTAWVFPNPGAKAEYLEFKGEGLNALKTNLSDKVGHMAVLGARMLEAQPKGVESANTAAIHRGGEQSMLASVSQSLSIGLTKVLQVFTDFTNNKGTVKYTLNKDFFPMPMDALTLTAYIAAWQNQSISYDTLFNILQKAEVIDLDITMAAELAAIKSNPPPVTQVGTTPGDRASNGPSHKGGATSSKANKTITQLQNS